VKWSKKLKLRKGYIIFTSPVGGGNKKGEALQICIASLIVKTSPINKAVASGNGKRFVTQKLHVQIANKPRSLDNRYGNRSISLDNAGLKFNYCLRFDPHHFSLPSTFKYECVHQTGV
jgi:hypothetical protein